MVNSNLIVLSEKYNCFAWLVARTGSNHMVSILKNFNFKIYNCIGKNKKLYDNELKSIHTYNLFEGSETYKFLISVRNPYAREVSSFRMNKYVENSKESFKDFLEKKYYSQDTSIYYNRPDRLPDYYVRMEHMFEDYSKIPFIVESEYFKSGKLEKQVSVKINYNSLDDRRWEDFYDDNIADIVYYNNLKDFNLFGYDKNSYKK
jgi:hypothetical protein